MEYLTEVLFLITFIIIYLVWYFYQIKKAKDEVSPFPEIDAMYKSCKDRDRSQSFDDWVSQSIQLMAIDEIEPGKVDKELVDTLKEQYGENTWEWAYPPSRVKQELAVKESYWTALKKFDDKVAKEVAGEF